MWIRLLSYSFRCIRPSTEMVSSVTAIFCNCCRSCGSTMLRCSTFWARPVGGMLTKLLSFKSLGQTCKSSTGYPR